MSNKNLYDEVEHFFGDARGKLFTALNYKGTQFGVSLNTKENPETILNEPMFQLMLQKNYLTAPTHGDMQISTDFVQFVRDVAARHKALDTAITATRPALPTGEHLRKLKHVYQNWPSMTADGRDFYRAFINLVDKTDRTISADEPGVSPIALTLNLKKVDYTNLASETVFGSTLPYLPPGMVDAAGNPLSVDYLHREYDNALTRGTGPFVGGSMTDLLKGWTTYDAAGNPTGGLDKGKFLRAALTIQHKVATGKVTTKTPLDDIYDMATGQLYKVKDGKLYNKDDEEMDDAKYEKDLKSDCVGTHLPDCNLVFECLLSGDSKSLSRCLAKLSLEKMYNVAKDEVNKMNPRIIKKVLDTFDVKPDKYGKPEEYLVWRANFESRLVGKMGADKAAKTAAAVLGNQKLVEYIRHMMDILREMPTVNTTPLSDLEKKTTNIRYFIKPKNVNRAQALSTQLTSLVNQLNVLPQNFVSTLNMPLNLANVNFGNPFVGLGAFGMLRGGNATCVDETIATMESVYRDILDELNKTGRDLVDEDKKRIEEALDQLKKNNEKLTSALNDLKAFLRLNSALTAGIDKVSLNDARGAQRISLDSQVGNLQSCIETTASTQKNLIQTLVNQVFHPMINLAAGISTVGIRPF